MPQDRVEFAAMCVLGLCALTLLLLIGFLFVTALGAVI